MPKTPFITVQKPTNSQLRSLEPTKYISIVPLGWLLKDGSDHFSATAGKNRQKGIAQLRQH